MRRNGASGSQALSNTIESLYAAALDETLWHDTLTKITALFGGVGSILVGARWTGGLELTWVHEHVPTVEGHWDHHIADRRLDIKTAQGLSKPLLSVYTDCDFIADREIDRHPFYQEFMACYDFRYTIGSQFPGNGGGFGIINVFRNRQQGHYGRPHVKLMEALLPHLTRACDWRATIAGYRSQRRLREALDQVPEAIFLLEPDARIVDTNCAAEQMLRVRDGLSATHSRLGASHRATRKRLADTIAAVAEHRGYPNTLPIPRPSSGRPLQALVIPMPRTEPPMERVPPRTIPLVMLVVSDPDALPMPLPQRLAVLWGLTPAESRLAAGIANGESVQDYAGKHCLSENTVRRTLKRLLAKSECRRQSEMVRLLATAAAAW